MTVEQIAIRQEIRQMLNEAGINKNTLKDMAKEVLNEEINRAVKQAINERDLETEVRRKINTDFDIVIRSALRDAVATNIRGVLDHMTISIDVTDKHGTSSICR